MDFRDTSGLDEIDRARRLSNARAISALFAGIAAVLGAYLATRGEDRSIVALFFVLGVAVLITGRTAASRLDVASIALVAFPLIFTVAISAVRGQPRLAPYWASMAPLVAGLLLSARGVGLAFAAMAATIVGCYAIATAKPSAIPPEQIMLSSLAVGFICATGGLFASLSTARSLALARRRQEQLAERERLLQLVLRTLPVGVVVTDSAGDITIWNDASEAIWGGIVKSARERANLINAFSHGSGERLKRENWGSLRAISKGETSLNELIDIESYDGRRKIVSSSAVPIREPEGTIVGAVVVNEDVTERVHAEEALRDAHKRLRFLSRRRAQVQEEERRSLARELHDQIGQLLTAAKMNVQSARTVTNAPAAQAKLANAERILDDVLEQARQISFALRPSLLDDLGIAAALQSMLDEMARATGIRVEFSVDPDLERGDTESETACYRVAAEAVTNAVRHAKPKKICVELRNVDEHIRVCVRDDGSGFLLRNVDRAADRDRLGIIGMRERAFAVGGSFEINSEPGKGTEVTADFPTSAAPIS